MGVPPLAGASRTDMEGTFARPMTELVTGKAFPYVVVTGIAMTTALATDAETTWKLLLDRQSGIRTLDDPFVEEFDLPVRIGGHLLEEFDHQLTRIELRRMGYLQRMSTVLSRRLWENAGSPEVDTNRLMVSIGTGLGSAEELVFSYDDMRARGMKAVSPLTVQKYMPNGAAAAVGLERHAKAGVMTPVSACASGAEAIARAWQQIVLGEADAAICGGVETRIEAVPIAGFAQMRIVMSTNNDDPAGACRPFDRDRDGFVFGEGGALLLIETEEWTPWSPSSPNRCDGTCAPRRCANTQSRRSWSSPPRARLAVSPNANFGGFRHAPSSHPQTWTSWQTYNRGLGQNNHIPVSSICTQHITKGSMLCLSLRKKSLPVSPRSSKR